MAKEVLFLRQLLESINYCELFTTTIFADNMAANFLARNAKLTTRSHRHFDIRLHHIRDLVERKIVEVLDIASTNNTSDCLTKPLAYVRELNLREFYLTA